MFGFIEDEDEEFQPKEKERTDLTEKKVAKRCFNEDYHFQFTILNESDVLLNLLLLTVTEVTINNC